jgi:hypothetical protein
MRLLELATTGRLGNGQQIPDEMRTVLLEAWLQLISATTLAPYVEWKPIRFPVYRVKDPSGRILTERIDLSDHGVLEGKLEWLERVQDGLWRIRHVAAWFERESCYVEAREILDLLTRLNLILGLIEAIRDGQQLVHATSLMAENIENCLATFSDFGIISPELLGRMVATDKIKKRSILEDADAWESFTDAAFETWDEAEPYALRAREATTFKDFLEATLAAFPFYEGAVSLFYDAMPRYKQAKKEEPTELLRDFRVVEEYRVGALEVLKYSGHLLVHRVGHFLYHTIGHTVSDAVRKALNAARAEISVYPDAVRKVWLDVDQDAGAETVLSNEMYGETSNRLEQSVEQRIPSVYSDPDVVQTAFNLYRYNHCLPTTLDLKPGWQNLLFNRSEPLLTPSEVRTGAGTFTHDEIPAEELISCFLGEKGPSW